jgi:phosphate transport system substrate-binding protein
MKHLVRASLVLAISLATSGCALNEIGLEETDSELFGTLNGSGASSAASAQESWVAGFQSNHPDVTVNYDPTGSGTGRAQFFEGAVAFAQSDSYFKDEELILESPNCVPGAGVWEIPVYISPIAVMFNLDGVKTLNMSAETVAKIFTRQILRWDDPEIVASNPGVALPDLGITAVHRSDKSGTTGNFTDYLAQLAPQIWQAGKTEEWPAEYGGEGGNTTAGVISALQSKGTIGYADASRLGELGSIALKVGASYETYTPEGAAALIDVSEIVADRPATSLAYSLKRDTDISGVYPVALVTYLMGCNQYVNAATGALVREYASFINSTDGQLLAQEFAGSSPLSVATMAKNQVVIEAIR